MNEMWILFISAIGSAVGGFLGTILWFKFRLDIAKKENKEELIKIYLCANDQNQGQPSESYGELLHHHGKRVTDPNDLKQFDSKYPLWEWSRQEVGTLPRGTSTIYGPYTTDYDEPGLYSVVFKIRAIGLAKPKEIINDFILMELDINSTNSKLKSLGATISSIPKQKRVAIKYVRISDLAKGGWQELKLKFYSDGQGIWEYRVLPYDGIAAQPDNLKSIESNVRIVFDNISIYRIKKLTLPIA
jgi:hypothetical protein